MIAKSLYTITKTDLTPESLISEVSIDRDHAIFPGHFPDAPVTPGVVQMQIVKEILEKNLNKKLALKSMRTCKFLEVLNPQENPDIRINIKYKQSEMLDIVASGEGDGKVFFKMQASYLERKAGS